MPLDASIPALVTVEGEPDRFDVTIASDGATRVVRTEATGARQPGAAVPDRRLRAGPRGPRADRRPAAALRRSRASRPARRHAAVGRRPSSTPPDAVAPDGTGRRIRRDTERQWNPGAGPSRRSPPRLRWRDNVAMQDRGSLMRPSLNILEPRADRPDRRRGEAGPRRGRHGDPRARRCAGGCSSTGCRSITPASASSSRATSSSRRSPTRRARSGCYDRAGEPHADIGGDRVHFVPGSSGLKVLDHRTGETRLANSTDFVEYVRLADGLANIPYLATAFSTNDDIEASVSDAWRLYMTLTNSNKPVVSGAFTEHGVPRMVEMMQLFRRGPGRPHRPPDGHLHDHRDRQLPVQRGLLPEPDRLRRGGDRGRDRAGHADGADRAGDRRRGDGLPHGRRAGRDHDGPDHPARARRSCSAGRRRRST